MSPVHDGYLVTITFRLTIFGVKSDGNGFRIHRQTVHVVDGHKPRSVDGIRFHETVVTSGLRIRWWTGRVAEYPFPTLSPELDPDSVERFTVQAQDLAPFADLNRPAIGRVSGVPNEFAAELAERRGRG